MSGTKGYRSYRGRMPKGRIALMVILILVIVVSAAVIWLQNYVVYTADGQIRLELPWQREETPPAEEETLPEEDVEVIVQEPEGPPQVTALSLEAAPLTQVAWESTQAAFSGTAPAYNAAAVTLKDSGGHIYFAASGAAGGTVSAAEDTAAALTALTEGDAYTIARMSCFLDPIAARADVEGMGLKNTGGFIYYDGNNQNWLDPNKPAARQYLRDLAAEIADLGFDEILLTDLGYPTTGPLSKVNYGGANRTASVRTFLEELRADLAEYGVAISVELPAEVILAGRDDTAGLALADIAPLVDRVCAVTTAEQIPALEAAVTAASPETEFLPELSAYGPEVSGSCLILPQS